MVPINLLPKFALPSHPPPSPPHRLNIIYIMHAYCLTLIVEELSMSLTRPLYTPQDDDEDDDNGGMLRRHPISIWVRHATKAGNLIDVRLWQHIQEKFREKVEARLQGTEESDDDEIIVPHICVSGPGEIRAEFEAQLERERKEAEERKRQEEEASAKLIKMLQEEENRKLRERQQKLIQATEADQVMATELVEQQQQAEQQIRMQGERDAELARRLRQKEQEEVMKSPSSNKFKKKPHSPHTKKGPMDVFMGQMTPKSAGKLLVPDIKYDPVDPNGSFLAAPTPGRSKEDTSVHLLGEGSSPRKKVFGRQLREIMHSQSSESECDDLPIQNENTKSNKSKKSGKENCSRKDDGGHVKGRSAISRDVQDKKAKAWSCQTYDSDETDFEDDVFLMGKGQHTQKNKVNRKVEQINKRKRADSPLQNPKETETNIVSYSDEVASIDVLVAEQAEMEKRLQQEEKDRLMALALQEELDKQMRQVDRTRGSEDEYVLRDRKSTDPTAIESPVSNINVKMRKACLEDVSLLSPLHTRSSGSSVSNIHKENRKSCLADLSVLSPLHTRSSGGKQRQTTLFENLSKRKRTL
ncbi:unnamed protein product, partial [Meganyctiphanes norvegica]